MSTSPWINHARSEIIKHHHVKGDTKISAHKPTEHNHTPKNTKLGENHVDLSTYEGTALQENPAYEGAWAGESLEREERSSLRRVTSLATERDDKVDVEYRQLRLERVVLVGLWREGPYEAAQDSLRELAALAETAGSTVLDGLIQKRQLPDPATYLGSGKAKELAEIVEFHGADTVIVDSELAPSQRRALEDVVKVKVIDRTALILDIFAQHAKSREGKAQVELAQLEYLLPRLRGWGDSMSRQAGGRVAGGAGIGSRGPGETQLELDRRRIRTRMAKLRADIKAMEPARVTRRASRTKSRPRRCCCGVHERREILAPQHAHRRRRAGGKRPVRNAGSYRAPYANCRWARIYAHGHGWIRAQPANPVGGGVPLHAGGSWPSRSVAPRCRCLPP